jgi:hypothetical protein
MQQPGSLEEALAPVLGGEGAVGGGAEGSAAPAPAAEGVSSAPAAENVAAPASEATAPEVELPAPDLPAASAEEPELPKEELQRAVEIARRLREDPKAALKELEPVIEAARVAAGEALPKDIEELVERGDVTPEIGRELARLRMRAAEAEALRAERERAQRESRAMAAARAVSDYERKLMASDPNYVALRPVITRMYELEVRKGVESGTNVFDPAWAVGALQRVAREALTLARSMRPVQAAPRQVERGSSAPAVRGGSPSSLEEAIAAVLEGGGRS